MKRKFLLIICWLLGLGMVSAQKVKNVIVSEKAKKIVVQGQLLGRKGKPPGEVVEVFLYLDKLRGEADWNLDNKTILIGCAPKRWNDGGINVEMNFDEEATSYIRKSLRQDPNQEFSIHYNLFVDGKNSGYEGYCRFKLKDSQNDKADPQTTFILKYGFVVSDPEELSIFLISNHINTALDSTLNKESNLVSNANWKPLIQVHDLSVLSDSLTGQNQDYTQLGRMMSLYNFCNFYLDRGSFFSSEADSLLINIQRLKKRIESLQKDPPPRFYMDSLNRKLNNKLDSYQLYKLTELRLIETKQKIEAILRRSYLNFRK